MYQVKSGEFSPHKVDADQVTPFKDQPSINRHTTGFWLGSIKCIICICIEMVEFCLFFAFERIQQQSA